MNLHPVKNRSNFKNKLLDLWYGEPPKLIRKKPYTGPLNNDEIKRTISNRVHKVIEISDAVKIGIMGDFSLRMNAIDYRENYDYVIKIYKTENKETAINLEVALIKRFKEDYPEIVDNKSTARTGKLTTYTGFYHIYVVFNKS